MRLITLRLAAGYTYEEIACVLDEERPTLRHLDQPARFTKAWVFGRSRELKREVEESGAASY